MAFTFKECTTGRGWGTTSYATSAGTAVAIGDLIVIGIGTDSGASTPTGLTDTAGNTFTLRDNQSQNDNVLRIAWCVATAAHASDIFTASYGDAGSNKFLTAMVFAPDAGETVALDLAVTGTGGWVESPWQTGTGNTSADATDAVAAGFFHTNSSGTTFTNEEIPGGTAATVAYEGQNRVALYRILTAQINNIRAEVDPSGTNGFEAGMLVFKSTSSATNVSVAPGLDQAVAIQKSPVISTIQSLFTQRKHVKMIF